MGEVLGFWGGVWEVTNAKTLVMRRPKKTVEDIRTMSPQQACDCGPRKAHVRGWPWADAWEHGFREGPPLPELIGVAPAPELFAHTG